MAEDVLMTDAEFEVAAKVFLKYQAEKDQLEKKFKSLKTQMRLYMESKNLKTKDVLVDGSPFNVTWSQASKVVWEEERAKEVLEPRGLWGQVLVVEPKFDPNRIPFLMKQKKGEDGELEPSPLVQKKVVEREEDAEDWIIENLSTVQKNAPYVKVVAAKGRA